MHAEWRGENVLSSGVAPLKTSDELALHNGIGKMFASNRAAHP
jgi:hypothetical protein